MDEQQYIILAKYLDGEATEAEIRDIELWLASDPKHQQSFEEMKLLWQESEDLLQSPSFNTTAAWNKVSGSIREYKTQEPAKVISIGKWQKYMLAAAAVIVIGIVSLWNILSSGNNHVIAQNSNIEVTLPDGSIVNLREGSELEYPKTFKEAERNVVLKGEAFFKVARNEKQPFVIDAGKADVRVLGTSFNVKQSTDIVTVIVSTGKVAVSNKENRNASVILTTGEKATVSGSEIKETAVADSNYRYWQNGILRFSNNKLSEVITALEEYTSEKIELSASFPQDRKEQNITISFQHQNVEDMLTEICLIGNCRWTKQNDIYIVLSK